MEKRVKFFGRRGALHWDEFGSWVLAVVVLILIAGGAYVILTGKLTSAIDYFKNLLRFR